MTLKEFCIPDDVIEFTNADIAGWGKGRWRVAKIIPTLVDRERVEILPLLTGSNDIDTYRSVIGRYFVVIDRYGRSGIEFEQLGLLF